MATASPSPPARRASGLDSCAPVLLVRDVMAAEAYYRERLGFEPGRFRGEPPEFCMVQRDGVSVMLAEAPIEHEVTPHWRIRDDLWALYVWVDDARGLYREVQQRGATIAAPPAAKAYGVLEFTVLDRDGHRIAFGEPMAG